jgi:adenosine deaminase
MDTPRIDLHRHLEAAVDPRDLPAFIQKHKIDLPHDLERLRSLLLFTARPGNLGAFLEPFAQHIHKFFITEASVKEFTKLCVRGAALEGLSYVELRFSPFYMAGAYAGTERLAPEAVVSAVCEGRDEALLEFPIRVGLILIVGRELDIQKGQKVIDLALKYRSKICGVDLAGDEHGFPPHLFRKVFARAREAGIPITIHAGETGSAENIRYSVEELGATRIGHGIAAINDASVVSLLKEREIVLETCPISNWLTGAVKGDPSHHPLIKLHRAGVKVTVNTDDPLLQSSWLADDIRQAEALGATPHDIAAFMRNAEAAAFTDGISLSNA